MTKIGRNAPCPCGSGKKYKHCCSGKVNNTAAELAAEMEAQGEFADLEEVQAFVDQWQHDRNSSGLDDFQGLSPDQMHHLLNAPFDSPHILRIQSDLEGDIDAPVLSLFIQLAEAAGDQGIKPTATGNLPRNLCREIAIAHWGEARYAKETRFGGINSEPDFGDLHKTRLVAELAGLMRKYKGRFILTRAAKDARDNAGWASLYPQLLRTYVEKFNWAYEDAQPGFPIIQQSFAFTLWLLHRWGDRARPLKDYEDALLKAFPMVVGEAEKPVFGSAEDQVRQCYSLRCLRRAFGFLGLAELEEVGKTKRYWPLYEIRKTALLERVVRFGI